MDFNKESNKVKAKTILKNLEKRSIEGYFCESKDSALEKTLELIEEGSSVSWGGSATLGEIGIKDAVRNGNYKVIDREVAKDREEAVEIMRQALLSDYYLTSTNAITMDGQLVNIDGNGNRVAAITFGPKNVIFLVGMNKVTTNVENAIERIKNMACPPNTIRLNLNTPCSKTGVCADCLSSESICSHTVITRFSRAPKRIKVILVNESLGF